MIIVVNYTDVTSKLKQTRKQISNKNINLNSFTIIIGFVIVIGVGSRFHCFEMHTLNARELKLNKNDLIIISNFSKMKNTF